MEVRAWRFTTYRKEEESKVDNGGGQLIREEREANGLGVMTPGLKEACTGQSGGSIYIYALICICAFVHGTHDERLVAGK